MRQGEIFSPLARGEERTSHVDFLARFYASGEVIATGFYDPAEENREASVSHQDDKARKGF